MKEILSTLDPMMSKKLGVAMTAVICMAMMESPDQIVVTAMTAIAVVHTICQTVIDMKQGRKPE